jgi:hypothetical protein
MFGVDVTNQCLFPTQDTLQKVSTKVLFAGIDLVFLSLKLFPEDPVSHYC